MSARLGNAKFRSACKSVQTEQGLGFFLISEFYCIQCRTFWNNLFTFTLNNNDFNNNNNNNNNNSNSSSTSTDNNITKTRLFN